MTQALIIGRQRLAAWSAGCSKRLAMTPDATVRFDGREGLNRVTFECRWWNANGINLGAAESRPLAVWFHELTLSGNAAAPLELTLLPGAGDFREELKDSY